MADDNLTTTVSNCARCEMTHCDLAFQKFEVHPIYDSDDTIWNYWTLCPTTKDPILLKILDEENG